MITDRITLNLLSIYLKEFQANEGVIDSIQVSVISKSSTSTKSLTSFNNVVALNQYINKYAPLVNEDTPDCYPLNLYELRSFNVTSQFTKEGQKSNKNFIVNKNGQFVTDSLNINNASMKILNSSYIGEFIKVLKEFNNLTASEYIQNQLAYIDCGYIEVYFNESLNRIISLYKKYKHK